MDLGPGKDVWNPAQSAHLCVTLGEWLNISEPILLICQLRLQRGRRKVAVRVKSNSMSWASHVMNAHFPPSTFLHMLGPPWGHWVKYPCLWPRSVGRSVSKPSLSSPLAVCRQRGRTRLLRSGGFGLGCYKTTTKQKTNIGEEMERLGPLWIAGENVKWWKIVC